MRSSGFSLVEVTLAVLILALALIPIVSMIVAGTRQAHFNEDHAMAALLASQILERYRDESLDWLQANLAGERKDLIASDPSLTPKDDTLGKDYVQHVQAFDRSVQFVRKDAATGVLIAKIRWRRFGTNPQEIVEKLVLGRSLAKGARP